jgi:hypothetical protein
MGGNGCYFMSDKNYNWKAVMGCRTERMGGGWLPKNVLPWSPPGQKKRGRPMYNWKMRNKSIMENRGLEDGYWENGLLLKLKTENPWKYSAKIKNKNKKYERGSKSFRTGRLEWEKQMVKLSATKCCSYRNYCSLTWLSVGLQKIVSPLYLK